MSNKKAWNPEEGFTCVPIGNRRYFGDAKEIFALIREIKKKKIKKKAYGKNTN